MKHEMLNELRRYSLGPHKLTASEQYASEGIEVRMDFVLPSAAVTTHHEFITVTAFKAFTPNEIIGFTHGGDYERVREAARHIITQLLAGFFSHEQMELLRYDGEQIVDPHPEMR